MPIRPRFRRIPHDTIDALYGAIVAHARLPAFYLDYGVPDTVNGRFEMVTGSVLILLFVEHICQAIREVAAPLRELADFANESKKR